MSSLTVRELQTYSPKLGTTFVSQDAVASFPLAKEQVPWSMHVGRQELERYMHASWETPIRRERVRHVDPTQRRVQTTGGTYEVARQILDCSGPAMVVARALDDVTPIAPVYSRWAYFDITDVDDERFRADARLRSRKLVAYDVGRLRTVSALDWKPSHTTILTQASDGVWTWQIPLRRRTLLSFGAVSRHGAISDAMLFELVDQTRAPCYTLRRTKETTPFGRVHQRNHFACRASVAASEDYILLGDAFAFADPIYSVGTGLAVSKAIEVATILNRGPWSDAARARYCTSYDALLERALDAFELWHSGAVFHDEGGAHEVQHAFLEGNAFQTSIAGAYQQTLADVGSSRRVLCPERRDRVIALLELDALPGWVLSSIELVANGLALSLERAEPDPVHVEIRWGSKEQFHCRAGNATLSYVSVSDAPAALDSRSATLMEVLRRRVQHCDAELYAVVEG